MKSCTGVRIPGDRDVHNARKAALLVVLACKGFIFDNLEYVLVNLD